MIKSLRCLALLTICLCITGTAHAGLIFQVDPVIITGGNPDDIWSQDYVVSFTTDWAVKNWTLRAFDLQIVQNLSGEADAAVVQFDLFDNPNLVTSLAFGTVTLADQTNSHDNVAISSNVVTLLENSTYYMRGRQISGAGLPGDTIVAWNAGDTVSLTTGATTLNEYFGPTGSDIAGMTSQSPTLGYALEGDLQTPEPVTLLCFGTGLVALGFWRRRRV